MRLLDRVGVLQALADRDLGGRAIHHARGEHREVAVAGDTDALEARVARFSRGPHAVPEPALVAAAGDLDPGEREVHLEAGLPIPRRLGDALGL